MVSGYFLADLLARFRRVFPNVTVQVIEEERIGLYRAPADQWRDHGRGDDRVDAGEPRRPGKRGAGPVGKPAVAAADHRFMSRDAIPLAEIVGEPLIALAVDEIVEASDLFWRAPPG